MGTRYLVVGGAGSLEVAPGVRLFTTPDFTLISDTTLLPPHLRVNGSSTTKGAGSCPEASVERPNPACPP